MSFKLTPIGRVLSMDTFTGQRAAPLYAVGMYQNNLDPTGAETNSSYTVCDFTGYAEINVTSWSDAVDDGTSGNSFGSLCLFVAGGPFVTGNTVYGYLLRNRTTGDIVGGEKFATGPFVISAAGQVIPVIPRLGQYDL